MLESYLPLKDLQEKLSFRKYANPNQLLTDMYESILRKKRIIESMERIISKMSARKTDEFEFFISIEEIRTNDESSRKFKLSPLCPVENSIIKVSNTVDSEKSTSEKVSSVKFNLEPEKIEEQKNLNKSPQQQQAPKKRVNVALTSMMNNPMPFESSSSNKPLSVSRPTSAQQGPLLSPPNLPKQNIQMPNFSNISQNSFPSNQNQRNQTPLLNQYQNPNMQSLNQNQFQSFFPSASTRQFNQQPNQLPTNQVINNTFMTNNKSNSTQQQNNMNTLLLSKPSNFVPNNSNSMMNQNSSFNNLDKNATNHGFPTFLPNLNDVPGPSKQGEKLEQMIRNFEIQQKLQHQPNQTSINNNLQSKLFLRAFLIIC
jgi:hypothetical protein